MTTVVKIHWEGIPLLQDVTKIRNGERGNLVSVGKGGREPWERGWEQGMSIGKRKFKKREQCRQLEMKLLLGLGFKLGFVPIFHCPAPRAVPRFQF